MDRGLGSIEQLRLLWRGETGPSGRRACWSVAGAGLVAALLVGRIGEDWSRAAAAFLCLLAIVPALARWMLVRQRQRDPRAVMDATIMQTQPELAKAAIRALALSDRTQLEPELGSNELAKLHLARLLGRASLEPLVGHAGRTAWRATAVGVLLAMAAFSAAVVDPFRLVEGADVLVAHDGVAPVNIHWIELPRVSAEPPAYLHRRRRPIRTFYPTALHVGTVVSVYAAPRHDNRHLVLSDGELEVPFYYDGDGELVARWTLTEDATLKVAARFGEVLVEEPRSLDLHAIADHAPNVRVDGAPATHRLLDTPRISIHYEAIDDHGIREVALVLRAGERIERRSLSKPQGGVAIDRGGLDLRADDPFLKRSYLPVEVTVEALDNDPISGPKWGRSDSIVVIPPQIGERESMRYRALRRARDAVTDLLAARIDSGAPAPTERTEYKQRQTKAQARVTKQLRDVTRESFGGLRLTGRLASLVRGQVELLDKSLTRAIAGGSHDKLVRRSETLLLAVDSALGALGQRDTQTSALKLSEVAADAAGAIDKSRDPDAQTRASATRRLDADVLVLGEGGKHLLELGELGRDLGEIVANGLRRIDRAWKVGDRYHAHLAALDLAARLRMPDASFGSSGGGGHQQSGGVEAGGMPQPGAGEASSAAGDAAAVEQALEQLRLEHAAEMAGVQRALDEALSPDDKRALEQELREAAKRVRQAVSQLPQQASNPTSARAAAAQARSQAESMAGALEKSDLEQAAEQGKRALESLRRAERQAAGAASDTADGEVGELAQEAREKLQRELDKAQQALQQMRQQASERARGKLDGAAKRERELAERARQIRQQSSAGDAPLPGEMLKRLGEAAKAMDDAARKLEGHQGSKGLEMQREAQRLLEMSQPDSEQESKEGGSSDGGHNLAQDADVPGEGRDESADAFRKRVTKGLGRKAPSHLREALRRYTEGLLQ